jgi:UDP-N-acetylglucosamine--N-acetylmuramyl-(pentapeptide) pyrophosphoryl-undecaprenol N-acetylglucosamine transferase
MKAIIAGGGTGGHLFPGIAVAEELRTRGHEVRFVGTARGLEARVVPAENFGLDLIDVAGLKGGGLGGWLRGLFRVPRALLQSGAILRREKPDLVVGVGGYASGPLVLTAAWRGIPTAILEQNSVPGMTNRILGKIVKLIFGAFRASEKYFPKKKFRLVGNPIRKRIRDSLLEPKDESRTALLVVGGSQGAHAVNELVAEAVSSLDGIALLHQTGAGDYAAMQQRYAGRASVEVVPFIDDMAAAYRRAKLVVARAGASTLAELTALGVPSLLIPFPFAADDHQTKNARELEEAGAARVLIQKQTTADQLARHVRELFADDAARAKMAAASRTLGRPDAHAEIVDALLSLAHDKDRAK